MKNILGVMAATLMVLAISCTGSNPYHTLEGKWEGNLVFDGNEFSLNFYFDVRADDNINAFFDISTLNAAGVPVRQISFEGNRLKMKIPALNATYSAVMDTPDTLSGNLDMDNQEYSLILTKINDDPHVKRNYPSSEEALEIGFDPQIPNPVYENGQGPLILIDEGHCNYHKLYGLYKPFGLVLLRDGYKVQPSTGSITQSVLNSAKILVISNALHETDMLDWKLPTPSAFTNDEIETISTWVGNGGSLFLIADHMPFPGSTADLAAAFGFEFYNGFAFGQIPETSGLFTIQDGSLKRNIITQGGGEGEAVDSIRTFTGQAFKIPDEAIPILEFGPEYDLMMPEEAWIFDSNTDTLSAEGMFQGAIMEYGEGRIAVFGEAAMFTTQVSGSGNRVGIGTPDAPYNMQFLLNIIHWLDGQSN